MSTSNRSRSRAAKQDEPEQPKQAAEPADQAGQAGQAEQAKDQGDQAGQAEQAQQPVEPAKAETVSTMPPPEPRIDKPLAEDDVPEADKHQGTIEHEGDTDEQAVARDMVGDRGVNGDGSPVTLDAVVPDKPGRGNDQPHTRDEAGRLKVAQDALDQPTVEAPSQNPGEMHAVPIGGEQQSFDPRISPGSSDTTVSAMEKVLHSPVMDPPSVGAAPLEPPAPRAAPAPPAGPLTIPEVGTQLAAVSRQRIVGHDLQVPDPETVVEKLYEPGDAYVVKKRLLQETYYPGTKRPSYVLIAAVGAQMSGVHAKHLQALVGEHYEAPDGDDDSSSGDDDAKS